MDLNFELTIAGTTGTPIAHAAGWANETKVFDIINELIKLKAAVNTEPFCLAKNPYGPSQAQSPVDVALDLGRESVVEFLLQIGGYRSSIFDLHRRVLREGKPIQLESSKIFEAHATVSCSR